MIGHDHLRQVRLGEVDVQLLSTYPLWTYAENIMKIHQHLAEIWWFIGGYGHNSFWPLGVIGLGEVDVHFMCVCQLWA